MPSVTCFSAPVVLHDPVRTDTPDTPDLPDTPDTPDTLATSGTPDALGAAVRTLLDLGFELGPPQPATRSWLDTFDGRLAAAGARLDARPVYKPGSAAAVELCPHGAALPDRPLVVERLPRRPDELPAGQFRVQLTTLLADRSLLVRLTMRSSCVHGIRRDASGAAVARVELHTDVQVTDGDGEVRTLGDAPWCLELHQLVDDRGPAAKVRRRLVTLGLERTTADALGWAARRAGVTTGDARPTRTRLRRRQDALSATRAVLHDLGDAIDRVWDGTRADLDPEFLHDLRTSLRRARAVLSAARGVLPEPAREAALDLAGGLADRTSTARDLDVQLADWDARAGATDPDVRAALEPARDLLGHRRDAAHRDLAAALDEIGRVAWSQRWHALVDTAADPTLPRAQRPHRADRRIGKVVAARIERSHRRLVRAGREITDDSAPGRLHDLRKDAKRLRYLVEAVGSLVGRRHRQELVRRLKVLLDHLGEHQDAVVRHHQLQTIVLELRDAPPATCAALADLVAAADDEAARHRARFADVWERFDRRGTRRALDRVLDDLRA